MPSAATIVFSRPAPAEMLMSVSGVVDGPAVEEIAVRLSGAQGSGTRIAVIDLSGAPRCDIRVLTILDQARRALAARGGVLHIRGLTPESFTGLTDADLPSLLDAYRASLGVSEPTGPWEPGGTAATPTRSPDELGLVRACTELAGVPGGWDGGRGGVLGVADRLVENSMRYVGASAVAVVLREPTGRSWLASHSDERSRLLETSALITGEGPAMECLLRGEPVSSPHLDRTDQRWAVYSPLARQHGFAAARGLPIRPPAAFRARGGGGTIGALSLLSDTAGPMAVEDLEVAQGFADLAAIAFAIAAGRGGRVDGVVGVPPTAMAAMVVVEQAKGVLAVLGDLTMAQAEAQLRLHALVHGVDVSEVALEVTEGRLTRLDTAETSK